MLDRAIVGAEERTHLLEQRDLLLAVLQGRMVADVFVQLLLDSGAIDYGGEVIGDGMLFVNSGSMRQPGNLLLAFAPDRP